MPIVVMTRYEGISKERSWARSDEAESCSMYSRHKRSERKDANRGRK